MSTRTFSKTRFVKAMFRPLINTLSNSLVKVLIRNDT